MRTLHPLCLAAVAALTLADAHAASAQSAATQPASRVAGCRGTTTQTSSFTSPNPAGGVPVVWTTYPVIDGVQPGSPAAAAGFRAGDVLVLQDGRDVVGQTPARQLFAGDTVTYVVRRDGEERTLTAVLGRWDPPQEAPGVTRTCRPMPTAGG